MKQKDPGRPESRLSGVSFFCGRTIMPSGGKIIFVKMKQARKRDLKNEWSRAPALEERKA
jgi:hypothetical protein